MSNEKINQKEINKITVLARINLTAEEEEKFAKEIDSILDYFNEISLLSVGEEEKFNHYELKNNQLREDKLDESLEEEKKLIRNNFPKEGNNYLKVKTALKK